MRRLTREECERDPNAALDSAMTEPVAIVDETGAVRGVLCGPGARPSRTLEQILAYSRETGMDWALTADEAGLLRREVERLSAQLAGERAKREAAEDRADKSERGLHVAESLIRAITIRNELDGVDIDSLIAEVAGKPTMRERAEKAEARVAVLGSDISCLQFDQRTLLTQKANLETQLAEERAKRALLEEGLERGGAGRCGCDHAPCRHDSHRFLDERETETKRADKAERELAEEKELRAVDRMNLNSMLESNRDLDRRSADTFESIQSARGVWVQRVEKAEARAKDLAERLSLMADEASAAIEDAFETEQKAIAAEKRVAELDKVAELQALADALQWLQEATSDVDGGINGLRFIPAHVSCGVLIPGKWHVKRRDSSSAGWGETIVQAIALARDLGKKEPTR
jgi:hypothetical protein